MQLTDIDRINTDIRVLISFTKHALKTAPDTEKSAMEYKLKYLEIAAQAGTKLSYSELFDRIPSYTTDLKEIFEYTDMIGIDREEIDRLLLSMFKNGHIDLEVGCPIGETYYPYWLKTERCHFRYVRSIVKSL